MIVKTSRDEIQSYLEDNSNFPGGSAEAVYLPETEEQVCQALSECARRGTPVTVSGGGTGNVGGRIPLGGALLSVERMNRILEIDREGLTARLEGGVVIKEFLSAIEPLGLFYPPFPTERSAFIGGNVATNASGEYSYRYGATRAYVRGLRLALSTGEVLAVERGRSVEQGGVLRVGHLSVPLPSYRTPEVKCAAGYFSRPGMDAIDLIIGSEGTLGVVTEVTVSLIPALPPLFTAVLFFPSEEPVLPLVSLIGSRPHLDTYCLEFLDERSMTFARDAFPNIPPGTCALYIEARSDPDLMEEWAEIAEEFGAADTWIGEDDRTRERLLDFRHRVPENVSAYFRTLGIRKVAVDAAVPGPAFPRLLEVYNEIRSSGGMETVLFGHIGEHHLHFNFFPRDAAQRDLAQRWYRTCVSTAIELGGTASAEHGIGKMKHEYLEMMFGARAINEMAAIKKIFDPFCILGLDNLFPRDALRTGCRGGLNGDISA